MAEHIPNDELSLFAHDKLSIERERREEIESHGKKKRTATTEAVRVSRVKIPLRSGVAIALSGTELGMSGVVESLAETLKEARKASDAGFDVKTWQAMMADKAKGQA